jgi:hypothetical protein
VNLIECKVLFLICHLIKNGCKQRKFVIRYCLHHQQYTTLEAETDSIRSGYCIHFHFSNFKELRVYGEISGLFYFKAKYISRWKYCGIHGLSSLAVLQSTKPYHVDHGSVYFSRCCLKSTLWGFELCCGATICVTHSLMDQIMALACTALWSL